MEDKEYTIPVEYLEDLRHWAGHPDTLNNAVPGNPYEEVWARMGKELGFDPSTQQVVDPGAYLFRATPTT